MKEFIIILSLMVIPFYTYYTVNGIRERKQEIKRIQEEERIMRELKAKNYIRNYPMPPDYKSC